MKTPLAPLGDRVIAVQDEPKSQTSSGLYLPEKAKEKSVAAIVEAVGPDVKDVKVGDKIIYREYSTSNFVVDKVTYLVIKQEDILAKVQ